MKILFKNADILVFENGIYNVIKQAFLAVDGDKISYIGKNEPTGIFDETKDIAGKLLMSGFYNSHNHCPMVLLRGVGSDLPLNEWLFDKVFPIEDKLTAEEIEAGTNLALLEMIAGGTVSFTDMYFEPQVTAKAVAQSGMKANLTRPVQSFDPNEEPEDSFRIAQSIELYNEWNKAENDRILIDFSIHAEYTCTEKIARAYIEECNKRNGNMHIHLSETVKEHNECKAKYGKTPTEWFNDLGAFESRAFAAHCVTLEDSDMAIFLQKGISVAHCPSSNMKLGSGFARVPKMLGMGINVAIGTDGAASNNNLDMVEELHLASIIHNGYMQDATIMNADAVIRMATINGALLQGRDDCGELKVGNKADIIAISLDKPHLRPIIDEKSLITYSAQSSDVYMTMVDGKVLYENGDYKTLDKEKIYYDIEKAVAKLY